MSPRETDAISASQAQQRPLWSPRKTAFVVVLTVLVLGAGIGLWAQSTGRPQPSLGLLIATPPNFVFNKPTVVTFTIVIDTATLNPTTVELLRVDSTGATLARVGRMYDNGQNGDVKPGDKRFTAPLNLNEATVGRIYFRVGASFRGNTQDAQSGVLQVDVDPFPLPPDPGEGGKQTLAGVDTDGDGLRDDLQRHVAHTFPEDVRSRLALTQLMKAQQILVLANTRDAIAAATKNVDRAQDCMYHVVGVALGNKYAREAEAVLLNTKDRLATYLAGQSQLSGSFFRLTPPAQRSSACDSN